MNLEFTGSFRKKAKKLCHKDRQLRVALIKQFSIFQENFNHPSLKLHKLQGKRSQQYAIWIHGNVRALGIKNKDEFIFFDLARHDQY